METINDLTYVQILKYYNFKEIKRTAFVVVYSNNFYKYAVFRNQENVDELSWLDVLKKTLITKEELLHTLSPKVDYTCFIDEIKKIDNTGLNLSESISPDNVIKYFYPFFPLRKENKNISGLKADFLYTKQFRNIYQDEDENILIPLSAGNQEVNYYIENRSSVKTAFEDTQGYYTTKPLDGNNNILISFGLFNVLRYFSQAICKKYLAIIPNPNVNPKNTGAIVDYIKENSEERFKSIIFLYNSDNIQELISIFGFFIYYASIKSRYKFFLNKYSNNMILKVHSPNNIQITELFEGLNKDFLDLLDISENDNAKKERLKDLFFDIKSFDYENDNSKIISFVPKVETIDIVLNKLNKLIFGENTIIEFCDVKTIDIKERKEEVVLESSIFKI